MSPPTTAVIPASRVGSHEVLCGDWVLHLHESEDPLPEGVCAVRLSLLPDTRPGRDRPPVLWASILVGDAAHPRDAVLAPVRWAPAPEATWVRGEVFEAVVGPLGVSAYTRATVNAVARDLSARVAESKPGPQPDPERYIRAIESAARQAMPTEFAILAAATRALRGEPDDAIDAAQEVH